MMNDEYCNELIITGNFGDLFSPEKEEAESDDFDFFCKKIKINYL
jgi:hypothetical protein